MSVIEIQDSNKKLKELIDQKKFDAPELKRLLKLLKVFFMPNWDHDFQNSQSPCSISVIPNWSKYLFSVNLGVFV